MLRESRAGVGAQRDLVRLDANMLHLLRHLVVVIPVHDRASQRNTRFIQDLGLEFGAMRGRNRCADVSACTVCMRSRIYIIYVMYISVRHRPGATSHAGSKACRLGQPWIVDTRLCGRQGAACSLRVAWMSC